MRFLADENVEAPVIRTLRELGHEVLEVGGLKPGAEDDEVTSIARERGCILVTNDKDFGRLVFLQEKRVPGALLLRLPGMSGQRRPRSSGPRSERPARRRVKRPVSLTLVLMAFTLGA